MIFFVTLTISLAIASAAEAEIEKSDSLRNPKLFFVSSTTSTLSTTTICYVSSSSAAACGRKRRSLVIDSAVGQETLVDLGSISARTDGEEDDQPMDREGKFLLYWMTTTSTSTTFTATTTVSSLACTPSGFTISNCSG